MVFQSRSLIFLVILLNHGIVSAAYRNMEDRKKREEFKSKIFGEESLRDPKDGGLADEDFEPLLNDEVEEGGDKKQQQNAEDGENGRKTKKAEKELTNDGKMKNPSDGGDKTIEAGGKKDDKNTAIPRRNSIGPTLPPMWNETEGMEKDEKEKKKEVTETGKKQKPNRSHRRSGMEGEEIRSIVPTIEEEEDEAVGKEPGKTGKKQRPGRFLKRSGLEEENMGAAVPTIGGATKDETREYGETPAEKKKKDKANAKEKERGSRRNTVSGTDMKSLVSKIVEDSEIDGDMSDDEEKKEKNYNRDATGKKITESVTPELDRIGKNSGGGKSGSEGKTVGGKSKRGKGMRSGSTDDGTQMVRKRKNKDTKSEKERGILEKIYNITDTGVSEEFLFSKEYADLLEESEKIKLKKVEMSSEGDIPMLQTSGRNMPNFRNSDIPEELLTYRRSESNAHIPTVFSVEDIGEMAKKAIMDNDLSALRGIIEKTGNPDFPVDKNRTVLEFAIENDNYLITRYLIYSGASINRRGVDLNTPMHVAVNSASVRLVKLLIENGSNLNDQNFLGETPLMLAIVKNYEKIAYELLKSGANINSKNKNGETAYSLCLRHGRGKIQQYLAQVIKTEGDRAK
ncbi:MAG: ankyrin repeat domain-containing protein [Rickettsiales bacterium]|jgi:hypothetical protein|nr:ankyrin repeat domain-containing protein [Rickettsiales bacterium]